MSGTFFQAAAYIYFLSSEINLVKIEHVRSDLSNMRDEVRKSEFLNLATSYFAIKRSSKYNV